MPWTAPAARQAGTVHVGGTMAEVAAAEAEVAAGRHAERPFVLVAQQSLADPKRAPDGHHTLWAYCHVPAGSTRDVRPAIEAQFDRFAPGWRSTVLDAKVTTSADLAAYNENCIEGDIGGGAMDRLQLVGRPFLRSALHPYRTPEARLFLCSASTPPGAGVHGMCGWHAANDALRTVLR
jgi:phytoene dehydrogenase-like protein